MASKNVRILASSLLWVFLSLILLGSINAEILTVTIDAGDYRIVTTKDGYHKIEMKDFGSILVPGAPILPSKVFHIAIPPGAKVHSVRVDGSPVKLPGTYKIKPAPGYLPTGSISESELSKLRRERKQNYRNIYFSDNPYPKNVGEYIGGGSLRKYRYVRVSFSPFIYRPKSGRLFFYQQITVSIDYSIVPLTEYERKLLQDHKMEDVARDILINYEQAKSWYLSSRNTQNPTYDYVIITTPTCTTAVTEFVHWKKSLGLGVKVVTTDWIYYHYAGNDIEQKTRNFLRDKYGEWGIEYVLIACSNASLPMRMCYPLAESLKSNTPTDYYYAELSDPDYLSWNSDGDALYGERGDDNVSWTPEVWVGRLPWDDSSTIADVCAKLIDFESDVGVWKKNALLAGAISNYEDEDTTGGTGSGNPKTDGAYVAKELMDHVMADGWTHTTLYEKGGLDPSTFACDFPLTHANFINEWSTHHYGVVCWHAHGSGTSAARKVWAWDDGDGIPEDNEMNWSDFVQSADAPTLNNDYPSIVFCASCLNGHPETNNNLGKELLGNGAAGDVASSRVSWYSIGWQDYDDGGNQSIAYYFYKYMITDGHKVGRSLYESKVYYIDHFDWWADASWQNMYDFNLYGDPALIHLGTNALPNLVGYTTPAGWSYPIVPRNTNNSTQSYAPLPATLNGNSNTTYLNFAATNNGAVTSPAFSYWTYLDGVPFWSIWYSWLDAGQTYGYVNGGPITVKGGRHTLSDNMDIYQEVYETNEYDNDYAHQFVWSPYVLANHTPVLRSAPPAPYTGVTAYPNCDGFSFADAPGVYWKGVGILPTSSGDDYDIRLHNDYTGSTSGFGSYLARSAYGGAYSDFVLVNENGGAPSGTYYVGVIRYAGGTGGFYIQRADDGTTIYAPDTTGTFTIHANDIIDVHEIYIGTVGYYRFTLDNLSGTANLGISLYDAHQPYFAKKDYISGAYANLHGGGEDESFTIKIDSPGYYGLVVWKTKYTDLGHSNTYKLMIERRKAGTWEGRISSNWHTPGNWFGQAVPDANTDVYIPAGTPHSPIVSVDHAHCRNLWVDSGATLTITNKSLFAHGHVVFYGTINATTTGGNYIQCEGNWMDYGTFNSSTGYCVFIKGIGVTQYIRNGEFENLTIGDNAIARILWSDLHVNGSLWIYGNLGTYSSGCNIKTGGVINIGDGGTLDATGIDSIICDNTLNIFEGGYLNLNYNTYVSTYYGVRIDGTVNCGTSSPQIHCGGAWIDTIGTFISGYSTVYFDGNHPPYYLNVTGGETFWNIVIDRIDKVVRPVDGNINAHNLDLMSGTLDINTNDVILSGDFASTGHLIMNDYRDDLNVDGNIVWNTGSTANVTNGEIRCGRNWYFNDGANVQLSGTNKVIFDGSSNGYIVSKSSNCSFNNVKVAKNAGFSLRLSGLSTHPIDVNGYFMIDKDATLRVLTFHPLKVAGNWINNGIFTPTLGTVIFDGTSPTIANGTGNNFCNLIINVSGTATTSEPLDINGNFVIASGAFNPGDFTHTVARDWNDSCGIFKPTSGTIEFDGEGSQSITTGAQNYFYNVTVRNSGDKVDVRALTALTVNHNLNVAHGIFTLNGKVVTVKGNVSVSGVLNMTPGSILKLDDSTILTVYEDGVFKAVGTSTDTVTVSKCGNSGYYKFTVYGKIHASYAVFEYMDTQGINVARIATVDKINNFSHCKFWYGKPGGALLTIDSADSLDPVLDVCFDSTAVGGKPQYNVVKDLDRGYIRFDKYSGNFAGTAYEKDPYNRIDWVPVGVEAEAPNTTAFVILQNQPNPFNQSTVIHYQLPVSADGFYDLIVNLSIYDLTGRLVYTLVDEPQKPGYYKVRWDGRDTNGRRVAPGVYFYKIEVGKFEQVKKMVLLR